jgi:hypothetical protein
LPAADAVSLIALLLGVASLKSRRRGRMKSDPAYQGFDKWHRVFGMILEIAT